MFSIPGSLVDDQISSLLSPDAEHGRLDASDENLASPPVSWRESRPAGPTETRPALTTRTIGQTARDDGIAFTVTRIAYVPQIARGEYSGPITPTSGTKLVQVDLTYRNIGRKPLDLLCSIDNAFRLIDIREREFAPHDSSYELPANDEACGNGLQPGLEEDAAVPFEVPASVRVRGLLAWNPHGDDREEGTAVFFKPKG